MSAPKLTPKPIAEIRLHGELRPAHDPLCGTALPRPRLVLRDSEEVTIHLLDDLFAGETTPDAVFRDPDPTSRHGTACVSPDNSFAIFAGTSAVFAVGVGGHTMWRFPHDCWGCGDMDSGSVAVSPDGRQVWATIPGDHSNRDPRDDYEGDLWVVLDAENGSLLASAQLDCAAAGSHHLVHPSGTEMALSVGEGQDGVPAYWGRFHGGSDLSIRGLGDRSLAAISPSGDALLSMSHYGENIRLHSLPHADTCWELAAGDFPRDSENVNSWAYQGLFVDDSRVIVSSSPHRRDPVHVMVRVADGGLDGVLTYPEPPSRAPIALGDGTWLTHGSDGWLRRWTT